MPSSPAYQNAEQKIEEALRTGATKLDLSCDYRAKDSEKLTELPESLGQLTQLRTLKLSNNQLTALPESLGQLTQLQTLNLSSNQLTALPSSMRDLKRLRELHVQRNRLSHLPRSTSLPASPTCTQNVPGTVLSNDWLDGNPAQ